MPPNNAIIPGKNSLVTRIKNLDSAWERLAPEAKFAGMTLSEFKTAMAPSLDLREQNHQLRVELRAGVGAISNADAVTRAITNQIVAAVAADPLHGPNSPLYRAMGFIPKNERKKPKQAETAPSPAA